MVCRLIRFAAEDIGLVRKSKNESKTRNFVLKTRNCVLKMMDFVGRPGRSPPSREYTMRNFALKTKNFTLKTKNCVSERGNVYLKMMNFAGCGRRREPGHRHAWMLSRHRSVRGVPRAGPEINGGYESAGGGRASDQVLAERARCGMSSLTDLKSHHWLTRIQLQVPHTIRNAPTVLMKEEGNGEVYKFAFKIMNFVFKWWCLHWKWWISEGLHLPPRP